MNIEKLLPSVLRHENIARIEDDVLLIGDRRKLPFSREFYKAYDASDAACAIQMMVTQGGGPLETALQAMSLTARKCGKNMDELRKAGSLLSSARKTNTTMKREIAFLLEEFESIGSRNFADSVQELVDSRLEEYDEKYLAMLRQPILVDSQKPQQLEEEFGRFICHIFDQPPEKAYRRSRVYYAKQMDDYMARAVDPDEISMGTLCKLMQKKIRRKAGSLFRRA